MASAGNGVLMLRKPIPLWVLSGGFSLTLLAGCINAVGFLSAQRQPLSHMSGTVCAVGMEWANGHTALVWHAFRVLLSFFLGALLSGAIIRQSTLKAGRRYGVALSVEAGLLFAATAGFHHASNWGVYFAAMACGLQNAMASSYSGAVIRTTHMTGMITDLGIACGHVLRGQAVEWRRFQLYGALGAGFLGGSYLGAVGFHRHGYSTLLIPAFVAGLIGFVFTAYKHAQRLAQSKGGAAPRLVPAPIASGSLPSRRSVRCEP